MKLLHWRRWLVALVLLTGIVLLGTTLSGCNSSAIAPLPPPPKVVVAPANTSVPDFSAIALPLPVIQGTTTTLPTRLQGGTATLRGRVLSGGAPVGGAVVRIERFVGDQVASTDLTADAQGSWGADNLLGGRFRVRAYRPPDTTMPNAQLLFLREGENRSLDLNLERYGGGITVSAGIAPDPPTLGEEANLVVSLSTRGVDNGGVARSLPVPDVSVQLVSEGGRTILTPNPMVTVANGRAHWRLFCATLASQELSVVLPDGSTHPLNVTPCRTPPPTTTTTTLSPVETPVP